MFTGHRVGRKNSTMRNLLVCACSAALAGCSPVASLPAIDRDASERGAGAATGPEATVRTVVAEAVTPEQGRTAQGTPARQEPAPAGPLREDPSRRSTPSSSPEWRMCWNSTPNPPTQAGRSWLRRDAAALRKRLRRLARAQGERDAEMGAVTFVQRYGGGLNLNPPITCSGSTAGLVVDYAAHLLVQAGWFL